MTNVRGALRCGERRLPRWLRHGNRTRREAAQRTTRGDARARGCLAAGSACLRADRSGALRAAVAGRRRGRVFAPSSVPGGWVAHRHDIRTTWDAPDVVTPDQGWKVHLSARLDRAPDVLDIVAEACFAERVRFKHLHAELFFLQLHHKHGPRQQSRKFCAAYPADEATARRLLDRLAAALADEAGPYVLTDRRYRDSQRALPLGRLALACPAPPQRDAGTARARRGGVRRGRRAQPVVRPARRRRRPVGTRPRGGAAWTRRAARLRDRALDPAQQRRRELRGARRRIPRARLRRGGGRTTD